MEKPDHGTTIDIVQKVHCSDCGWPIISACCNHPFTLYKDSDKWDWWFYCSNKSCKNHDGEGVFQNNPEWVEDD